MAQREPAKRGFWKTLVAHMEPPVFLGAAFVVVGFVLWGTLFTDQAQATFQTAQSAISQYFGWFYVAVSTALVGICIWLIAGRVGRLKLGGPDSTPKHSNFAWFTMLFSAGMGTGLMFWGVAEPVSHYLTAPPGQSTSMVTALRYSFFHWALHPWAIYAVLGVSIAYHHFRDGLPLAPRSAFHPLMGDHIYGPIGHVVDVLATVGTLLGVATSLGLGAMQINAGLDHTWQIPQGRFIQILIIAAITAVATISVVLGIQRGISRLSRFNISLALLLALFVLVTGPTLSIARGMLSGLGSYAQEFFWLSLWVADEGAPADWQRTWTLFYWGWWISWSPFVAVFTARISEGRTVRQYVVTLLVVPSAATIAWISIFGGTGLEQVQHGANRLAQVTQGEVALSLHVLLEKLPLAGVTTVLATVLVIVFFITSSDSGSLVDDMVTSGGDPDPPRAQRVFWAVAEGAVAATLLLAGGLKALQSAAIGSGLPMSLILVAAALGLLRALPRESQS